MAGAGARVLVDALLGHEGGLRIDEIRELAEVADRRRTAEQSE